MRDEGKRSQRPSVLPLNHWNVKRSCRSIVGHGHSEGQPGMDRVRRVTSFRSRCGHHTNTSVFAKCTQMHSAHVLFTRLAVANTQKTIHLSGIPEAWQNDWFAAVAAGEKNDAKQFVSIFSRNYSVLFRMRQAMCIMTLP